MHRKPPLMLCLLLLSLGAACVCAGACANLARDYMIDTPNQGKTAAQLGESSPDTLKTWGIDRQFRVEVGPPAASLLVWVIDPITTDGKPIAPKGTILVLHGFRNEMEWFSGKARSLSRHGFRTVLVDLRGQGGSTGDYFTYGVQEAKDMSGLIDSLAERNELVEPVGVWGMSYGASTAIMTSAQDPRVRAVVAIAPFDNVRHIVTHYVRLLMPGYGWCATEAELTEMIEAGAHDAGFDPSDADMVAAAARSTAPLLLMHGEWDVMVPAENSALIEAAARKSGRIVERITLPITGHVTIYFDAADTVERKSLEWFDRWLANAQ